MASEAWRASRYPKVVTSIGGDAFAGCSSLIFIEVGAANVNYTEVNGVLFNTEKTVLLTSPTGIDTCQLTTSLTSFTSLRG